MVESTRTGPSFSEFLELWERLVAASDEPGTVIVVEGERDRRALKRLRVAGPVRLVHRGRTLAGVAHDLGQGARRVIVLTDWDVEGGHLASRLRDVLGSAGVELDLEFRRRLARVLRGEVAHVEGLARWAQHAAERAGAPLEHFLAPIERP